MEPPGLCYYLESDGAAPTFRPVWAGVCHGMQGRGMPLPQTLLCRKAPGTMRASSPTGVVLTQELRLPVWSQALAAVCRGGFHIRPWSPALPQTGTIWNRPLHGVC